MATYRIVEFENGSFAVQEKHRYGWSTYVSTHRLDAAQLALSDAIRRDNGDHI